MIQFIPMKNSKTLKHEILVIWEKMTQIIFVIYFWKF